MAAASRQLGERKGVTAAIPDQEVLISTLGLHEAKDISAIENIVTTHDELCREASLPEAREAGRERKFCATHRPCVREAPPSREPGPSPATMSCGFGRRWG